MKAANNLLWCNVFYFRTHAGYVRNCRTLEIELFIVMLLMQFASKRVVQRVVDVYCRQSCSKLFFKMNQQSTKNNVDCDLSSYLFYAKALEALKVAGVPSLLCDNSQELNL